MKITHIFGISCICMLATAAFAQLTNTPVVAPAPLQVSTVGEALQALLHFAGFSGQSLTLALLVIHVGAKYIRNYLLTHVTTGQANLLHKLVALLAANPLPEDPKKGSYPTKEPTAN